MNKLQVKKILPAVGAVLGPFLVLGSILLLNGLEGLKNNKSQAKSVSFAVKRQAAKKKSSLKKIKPKPKKRSRPKIAPPNLGGALAGASFGLDQFEFLGNMGEGFLGDHKNVVMTEETVDKLPSARFTQAPEYPSFARKQSIEGHVMFKILVNIAGEVEDLKILASEPSGVFDLVAKNAVKKWQFEAASYQGQKVKVWVKQKISFNLN